MAKRRICVVVTARPSYSRIKTALDAIQQHPDLELFLVAAASALLTRYGAVVNQMREDGFNVVSEVHMLLEGENLVTMAKTAGLGLMELATVFDNLRPDMVLTIADRYETLATAVAAAYMNIPLVHIQGGEITGSVDEKVRHAVTKLSNLHLVSTERARERVVRMGERPETVFNTGCPSVDLAAEIALNPRLDFDPLQRYGGVGSPISLDDGYLVVLQHPVTTEYQTARRDVHETLMAIKALNRPTVWFWPNPDAGSDGTSGGIRAFRELEKPTNIHFFKSMAPTDFLRLIFNAKCLLGNSSVGIRESAFLGIPVVNIGNRQSGRERGGNVVDVEHQNAEIVAAVERQAVHDRYPPDPIYGDGKAGPRIADLLSTVETSIEKRLTY